jgi:hypothetical protein
VFYDSILFAALLFAYPVYCLLFALALTLTGAGTGMIIIATLLVPVSALYSLYSRLQLKYKEHAVSS